MNLLDGLIVLAAASAAVGGWRVGFLARAASWAGLAIGFLVASRALPAVVELFGRPSPSSTLLIAATVLIVGAFLGQALGLIVGHQARAVLPVGPARMADRTAGGLAGTLGVVVTLWLLLPAMADLPGWPARLARNSALAGWVATTLPTAPDTTQALRNLVSNAGFPQVFANLQAAPDAGAVPASTGLTADVEQRVVASTVKIVAEGGACDRIQEGSGFVVADGVVVTNAHVVAGEERITVHRPDGQRRTARVAVFDPDADLSVLVVPDLGQPPLPIGQGSVGAVGAVFGHPRGQDQIRIAPARVSDEVQAAGRDIYNGASTDRQVFVLAARLQPGDSGAALVDQAGTVMGVAFAIAPDDPSVAYALTSEELEAVLAAYSRDPAASSGTGRCLA